MQIAWPKDWGEALHWTEQKFPDMSDLLSAINTLISEAQDSIAALNTLINGFPDHRDKLELAAGNFRRASVVIQRIIDEIEKKN